MNLKIILNNIKHPFKIPKKIYRMLKKHFKRFPKNVGYCLICEESTEFVEHGAWLRDQYFCIKCKSIPRQKAFIYVLNQHYPNWRDLVIHESSPGGSSSDYIESQCLSYSASHFFPDTPLGSYRGSFRCEDLSNLTFEDESLDLILSQDVFEHVINPEPAFKEIARVLKPGGAHVFTMPWYPEIQKTRIRVQESNNEIIYLEEPVYHGNPISDKGSLVTRDWGLDFPDIIFKSSGLFTTIHIIRDRSLGIDGKFLEVFVSKKISS